MVTLAIIWRTSFSKDAIVKNYKEDDNSSLVFTRGTNYTMSFEAHENTLSSMRMYINKNITRITHDDIMTLKISDNEGFILEEETVYLFNSSRSYVNINLDNLQLKEGEWYYLNLSFNDLNHRSRVAIQSHRVRSFNEAIAYSQGDLEEEKLSLDVPIGFENAVNVSYYYRSYSPLAIVIAFLFLGTMITPLFIGKINKKMSFKELYRFIVCPLLLYLIGEILNISKDRPFNLFMPFTIKHFITLMTSLLIICLAYYFVYTISGKGTMSFLIISVPFLVVAFVNHVKLVMRGDSFMPWDVLSTGIAVKTGSTYYFRPTMNFFSGILLIVCLGLVLCLVHTPPLPSRKTRVYASFASLSCLAAVCAGFVFNNNLLDKLKIYYEVNPPIQSYNENGTYLAFLMHLNNIESRGKDNNSRETTEQLIYEYQGMASSLSLDDRINDPDIKPNVICIMSEAYSDLQEIRPFETSEPVTPYFDSLMDESMFGNLQVSIFGGGTCNTEFEFLTGCSMSSFLPGVSAYSYYVKDDFEALPNIYRDNGYKTVALHPFDGEWWDRSTKYPLLGFDEFYTRDDFSENAAYVRRYISDMETFRRITSIYEESVDPLFLFCITMQNHADFADRYDNMQYDIHIEDMSNEGTPFYYADNYLSLLRESDDALEYLIEYLRDEEEPTIVVFFGDHCPTLDNSFYDELLGTDLNAITLEESLPIYETPYFIWANYDLDNGTSIDTSYGNKGPTSANFLGQTVLDLSGIRSPISRSALRVVQNKIQAMSSLIIIDRNGNLYTSYNNIPGDISHILEDYASVQYGLCYFSDEEET